MSPETEENRVILPNKLDSLVLSQRERHRKETGNPRKQKGQAEKRNPRGKKKTKPAGSISTDCGAPRGVGPQPGWRRLPSCAGQRL